MNQSYTSTPVPSKRSAAFYAAYFAVLGVVLPYLGPYLQHLGVTAVGIGLITATFSLAKLAYAPIVGVAVDNGFWFRGMLTLHVGVSLVCAFALRFLDTDAWHLAIAFFLVGLGYGTVLPLVEATVLERLSKRRYGWLRVWGSIGFVVAASISGPVVAADVATRFPILLVATLAVLWMTCVPLERVARPAPGSRHERLPGVVWWLLALLTLHQVAHGPYYAFFSIHLDDNGFSSATMGAMWSLGVAAELAAFVASPWLHRWFGLRRLLCLSLLLSPFRWLLLALPLSTASLVVAQLGHALTYALAHLAGVQLVQVNVPAGAVRYAQALYSGLSFGLGIVVGSVLAGPLYGWIGGSGTFLVAAAFSVTLFVAWLPLARRLQQD
jgi:MFS transporter, PPP family, 3-phenylpropionic acid transporter